LKAQINDSNGINQIAIRQPPSEHDFILYCVQHTRF